MCGCPDKKGHGTGLWQWQDERCYYKGEGIKRLRRNDKRRRRRIPRMTQEMLMSKNWQATVFLPVVKVVQVNYGTPRQMGSGKPHVKTGNPGERDGAKNHILFGMLFREKETGSSNSGFFHLTHKRGQFLSLKVQVKKTASVGSWRCWLA